jgi:hypothetical protein
LYASASRSARNSPLRATIFFDFFLFFLIFFFWGVRRFCCSRFFPLFLGVFSTRYRGKNG